MQMVREERKRKVPSLDQGKIIDFINENQGGEFTAKQISLQRNIKLQTVCISLFRMYQKGKLQRSKRGTSYVYWRIVECIMSAPIPKGEIADCVWKVFHEPKIFLREEIREIVQNIFGKMKKICTSTIDNILSIFFHSGRIEKIRKWFGYKKGYSLKPEYWNTERPLIV